MAPCWLLQMVYFVVVAWNNLKKLVEDDVKFKIKYFIGIVLLLKPVKLARKLGSLIF